MNTTLKGQHSIGNSLRSSMCHLQNLIAFKKVVRKETIPIGKYDSKVASPKYVCYDTGVYQVKD